MRKISRRGWLRLMGQVLAVAVPGVAAQGMPDPADALAEQVSDEAGVSVAVKPLTLAPDAVSWRFSVQLSTHVSPLTQDLLQVSSLSGDGGPGEIPTAWDGDPPGGHHRKGVISFKPIDPRPAATTLTIRQVGGVPARQFAWKLPSS